MKQKEKQTFLITVCVAGIILILVAWSVSKRNTNLKQNINTFENTFEGLRLDRDIHPGQIERTHTINNMHYALVLRPSININLEKLPRGYEATFSGVLVANPGRGEWQKMWKIIDGNEYQKNNPYHLWSEGGDLILAVVDALGAGSGEGTMTLVKINEAGENSIIGCYYFGAEYNSPATHGDYYAFTQKLDKQEVQNREKCSGWSLIRVTN